MFLDGNKYHLYILIHFRKCVKLQVGVYAISLPVGIVDRYQQLLEPSDQRLSCKPVDLSPQL